MVADALAKAFNTDVNGLPLSLNLSWLEQKAIVVLLTLLHLGVKNIRIGPAAPAFLTPEALAVIVEKFNLQVGGGQGGGQGWGGDGAGRQAGCMPAC